MNEVDERRVIDALQAISGGLTVTDQDLREAQARLHEQIPPDPTRRHTAVTAIVAAAAVVAGVIGVMEVTARNDTTPPSPAGRTLEKPAAAAVTLANALDGDAYEGPREDFLAGRPPTQDDVEGLWLLRRPFSAPMVFDAKGNWSLGAPSDPWVGGPYSIRGSSLSRDVLVDYKCSEGPRPFRLSWAAAMADEGSLRLQFTGQLNRCTPADDREVWDRLLPGPSPLADYFREVSTTIGWEPAEVTEISKSFDGFEVGLGEDLYYDPRSGHLLEVLTQGRYRYYDDPERFVVEGTTLPADEGRLTTSQGAETVNLEGTCRGGRFTATLMSGTTPEVDGIAVELHALQVTPTSDGCTSGIAAERVWLRLGLTS